MAMRRQRCTECGSVFYTQTAAKVCGSCAPVTKEPKPKARTRKKAEPAAATAAPDATEETKAEPAAATTAPDAPE